MLRVFFAFWILLTSAFAGIAQAQESRDALTNLQKNVTAVTLSNGIRVLFYRRGFAPVFSGVVAVRVGGSDEQAGHTGISHMFEHMAFKGTSTIGTRDFAKEKPLLARLEQLVAAAGSTDKLSPEQQTEWNKIQDELKSIWSTEEFTRDYEKQGSSGMNATTDTELTRYFVSLPRSAFDFWVKMESGRLVDPVIRQFYQERDVVMEERRMRTDDSGEGNLYEALLGTAFTTHPYHYPVIGYATDIRNLTASAVDEFRKKYYIPSNIVIALVGDVDAKRDLPVLEKYFGKLKAGELPPRPTAVEPPQTKERFVTVHFPSQPLQYLAYHKPVYPNPDDAAISVLAELLAGSSISPLYEELVKRQRIAVSIDSDEAPGSSYPNLLIFSMYPRSPHTNKEVLAAFDKALKDSIAKDITPERLEIARRALAVEALGRLKTSQSIALDLASTELIHGDWRAIMKWYDQVSAVTVADLKRVANKYLVSSNRTVAQLETGSVKEAK